MIELKLIEISLVEMKWHQNQVSGGVVRGGLFCPDTPELSVCCVRRDATLEAGSETV